MFSTARVAAHAAVTFLGLGVALPVLAAFRVLGIGCLLFAVVSSWP